MLLVAIMLPLDSNFRQLSDTRQSSRRRKFEHPIGWIVRSANRLGTDQSLLASTQRNFGAFSYLRCAHPWKLSILHSGSRCHRPRTRRGPRIPMLGGGVRSPATSSWCTLGTSWEQEVAKSWTKR